MDWVEFVAETLVFLVMLYIGRWIGRREERREAPAPAPVVQPPPEVQTYTVEVGRLETFNVRATSRAQAQDDAVSAVALAAGGGPGRFIAIVGGAVEIYNRAKVIDNTPTSETP